MAYLITLQILPIKKYLFKTLRGENNNDRQP